jgi:hypothetical protein
MDISPQDDLVITLTSLWSGMIGGAIGSTTGLLGGSLVCQAPLGFVGGLIASVVVYLPMIGAARAIKWYVTHQEPEGQTAGGIDGDKLAGWLGGIAGAVGAVVVAALPGNVNLSEPHVVVICWTVVASVTIALGLTSIHYIREKRSG